MPATSTAAKIDGLPVYVAKVRVGPADSDSPYTPTRLVRFRAKNPEKAWAGAIKSLGGYVLDVWRQDDATRSAELVRTSTATSTEAARAPVPLVNVEAAINARFPGMLRRGAA